MLDPLFARYLSSSHKKKGLLWVTGGQVRAAALWIIAVCALLGAVGCSPRDADTGAGTGAGTNAASDSTVASLPRTADGRPDLNGIWQAVNEANFDLETHLARPAMALREGPYGPLPAPEVLRLGAVGAVPGGISVVEGGRIPYRPEALATRDANRQNWIDRDPEIRCYLPGVPRATYLPHPFQILQSDSALFIAYEYAGAVRNVYLEDPGPASVQSWMGQSVGRWEEDTFVIEVTGFNDQTWFDRAGNFHSDDLRVVERYTLTDPNTIAYSATIYDNATFAAPWTITMPLYRRLDREALMEFKCVEFVEELIYGQWRKNPLPR